MVTSLATRCLGVLGVTCLVGAAAVACTSAGAAAVAPHATRLSTARAPSPSPSDKPPVVVILMENHEYGSVAGAASAPYLNGTLIPSGTLFTNYYAVSHPSLPNYLALTVGDTCGKDGTDTAQPLCTMPSVWGQMSAAGITAREWAENESADCSYASDRTGLYAIRHDSYAIVADAEALASCGDLTTGTGSPAPGLSPLAAALASATPPAYSFVTPNLCDDMHDCSVAAGDSWLAANVPALLKAGAVVIVTFDEGSTDTNGGGRVLAVEAGPGVPAGARDGTFYTHYGLLAGIEQYFGLPLLANARTATPLPV